MLRLFSSMRFRLMVWMMLATLLGASLTLAVLQPAAVNWPALVLGLLAGLVLVWLAAEGWGLRQMRAPQPNQALTNVLNTLPPSIFWKDCHSVYLGCNAVYARIAGLASPEAIIGKTDFDLPWPPGDAETYRAADAEVVRTARPLWHIVDHLLLADGTRRWVETSKLPLLDQHGRVTGLVGINNDVTDRVQAEKIRAEAEAALARTLRALRATSECNQAVIHATDEIELYQAVCRIMVEIGGYRLAWVGLAEPDEAKTVRPAAQSGHAGGALELAGITWADEERGRGPTGTAIRTGQTMVSRDIQTDPRQRPWRDEAARRGYAASLALPLRVTTGPFGVLTIYSAEPDAFDSDEVKLLESLAGDLTHGVLTLRLRVEHDRAQAALQVKTQELDQFFNVALELLCIANTDGYFLRLNPMWAKTLGYSEAELLSHQFLDFVHPEDRDSTLAAISDLSAQKQVWHFENRYRCRDGRYRWIEWNSFPSGNRIYAAARDVTERRQVEAALRLSEDKFSKAFHTSPDSININRLNDGVYVDVNEGFTRLTGYTRAEVLGHSSGPGDLNIWARAEDRDRLVAGLKAQGEVVGLEALFRFKDGSVRTGLMSARLIEVEGELCVLSITRDISERKRMEEALRESEQRLREVFDHSPIALYKRDFRTNTFIYVSPAVTAITGYRPDEMQTMSVEAVLERIHPDDRAAVRQALDVAETRGAPVQIEYRFQRKAGQWVWIGELPHAILDSEGHLLYSIGTMEDITARKQIEAALRESEARYRLVAENVHDVIWTMDNDYRFTYVSPSIRYLRGLEPDEALNETVEQTMTPESYQIVRAAMASRPAAEPRQGANSLTRLEVQQKRKDGSNVWVEILTQPLIGDRGQRIGFVGTSRDISERKRAEEALRASEEKFRAIVEQFSEGLILVDERGRVIEWNRANEIIFGIPRSAVIDQPAWDVQFLATSPERRSRELVEQYRQRLLEALRTGQAPFLEAPIEMTIETPAGQRQYIQQVVFPIRTDQGWRLGTICRDITERKQADLLIQAQQEQLEAQNEQLMGQNEELIAQGQALAQVEIDLRQLNTDLEQRVVDRTQELSLANAALVRAARMKDEFLASMSHELRTPLTGILGLSEALHMGIYGALSDRQLDTVDTIYESGQHLLDLINDILDVSKIEAGKVELQLAPVPVSEVCQASLQFVRQMAQKKNLQLTTNHDFAVSVVQADGRRLKQMLVNLLSNAVKFTPEGGAVGLEVAGDLARREVRFSVWDTGIGIAREDLLRLFKPFVQLDSRLSRQYAGTGLGLSLVMGLAELHGGRVEVKSELGKGSRFTILLPWSGESPRALVQSAERLAGRLALAGRVSRALLVEDSLVVSDQLKLYLTDLGIDPVVQSRGRGVVEAAAAARPDVILLDILLPDISGWEVLAELKADPRTQAMPVIVVSVVDERNKAKELGVVGYLIKPVSLADLQVALNRGMERAILQQGEAAGGANAPGGAAGGQALAGDGGPVVLLADDSDIVISTVGDYLRGRSFQLAVAHNGGQALEKAHEIRPAVILMDIQMPGVDGLTAIRRLRADADAQLAATPIIALTALAMSGDRERCLAAGANDYVPKPVNLELLVRAITAQLMGRAT
jgi:PAS domain S-box-containing protein